MTSAFLSSHSERRVFAPATTEQDAQAPDSEVYAAAFRLQWEYNNSFAEGMQFGRRHEARMEKLSELFGGLPGYMDAYPDGWRAKSIADSVRASIQNGDILVDDNFNLSPGSPRGRGILNQNPAELARIQSVAFMDRMLALYPELLTDQQIMEDIEAQAAEEIPKLVEVMSRGDFLPQLGGTAVAATADPLILATLPFGASAQGATIPARLANIAKLEAQLAFVSESAIQAQAFDFRNRIGYPMTFNEAAFNTVAATLGATIFAPTIAGGAAMARQYRRGVEQGTIQASAEAEQAAQQLLAAEQAALTRPEGVTQEVHQERINQASANMNDGVIAPIEDADVATSQPVEGINRRLAEEDANGPALQDGATVRTFDPEEVEVDPQRFQFKQEGTDEFGVGPSLRGEETFQRDLAGELLVWEQLDGRTFVVDGHQRLGIARRAKARGQENVFVDALVLREADGVTAELANFRGAARNLSSTSGSALDAAKVFRAVTDPDVPGLRASTAVARQGRSIARLGDEAFGMVVNEVIPANQAALVGDIIRGGPEQAAAIQALARIKPPNQVQARAVLEQIRETGFETRTTGDLFGDREIAESLIKERAQVLDAALRQARQDSSTFSRLLNQRQNIEQAGGNVVDEAASAARRDEARVAQDVLNRLANVRGPVSEALTEAARAVRGGKKPATAARNVLSAASGVEIDPLGTVRPREHINGERTSEAFPEYTPARGLSPGDRAIENQMMDILEETPWDDLKKQYTDRAVDPDTGDYRRLKRDFAERIISVDVARELSPAFRADQSLSVPVHEPSSAFAKRLLDERLAEAGEGDFIHMAGGTGSGKTSALRANGQLVGDAKVILDGNLASSGSAIRKLKQAQKAGLTPRVFYVYTDPVDAVKRAVLRSIRKQSESGAVAGRTVPLSSHAATHAGAARSVPEVAAAIDNIEINTIFNTGGRGSMRVGSLAEVPVTDADAIISSGIKIIRDLFDKGEIDAATAKGFLDFDRGRAEVPEVFAAVGRNVSEGRGVGAPEGGQAPDVPGTVQRLGQRGTDGGGPAGAGDEAGTGTRLEPPVLTDRVHRAIKSMNNDSLGDLDELTQQAIRVLDENDITITIERDGQEIEISAREYFDELNKDELAIEGVENCMRQRGVA